MYLSAAQPFPGLGHVPHQHSFFGDATPPTGPITVANLASSLTNLVFWERNPRLKGLTLKQNTPPAAEWSQILASEVRPALHNSSAQWRIGQLIFFTRHPGILGTFKQQPQNRQNTLRAEFLDIRHNVVQPWLNVPLTRGRVRSRTIFVVDTEPFRGLPWETRSRAGAELADQFTFINGRDPVTVVFVEPARFPEEFNSSDAVVSVTNLPPNIHLRTALTQQVNNLNRALSSRGSRQRLTMPDVNRLDPERYGLGLMNKIVTAASMGSPVVAPLMAGAVSLPLLIGYLNEEYIPEVYRKGKSTKDEISMDTSKWSIAHKEMVGIALGRAMAHEVRHLYVRTPVHAADGLGTNAPRLFGQARVVFSTADQNSIRTSITALETQQGTRAVAASFAAAERSLDFPF